MIVSGINPWLCEPAGAKSFLLKTYFSVCEAIAIFLIYLGFAANVRIYLSLEKFICLTVSTNSLTSPFRGIHSEKRVWVCFLNTMY
ncbi:MAG: hypothetical protein IEMM0006_0901 [bacterium]|nr:MAG: hypothetical protein IEMM0006_0901 [bacterium]